MDIDRTELTVWFEDPFWVGAFQRMEGGRLSVCKVTFGAEPKDCEVWEYVLREYSHLSFSPTVAFTAKKDAVNPKRRQREARKTVSGIGTRSQQALQLQRETAKLERKTLSRQRREAEEQRRLQQKQQKRKEKHRGR